MAAPEAIRRRRWLAAAVATALAGGAFAQPAPVPDQPVGAGHGAAAERHESGSTGQAGAGGGSSGKDVEQALPPGHDTGAPQAGPPAHAAMDRERRSAGTGEAGGGEPATATADPEQLLRRAEALRRSGKLPQAATLLRQALPEAGDDAGLRARIHHELYFNLPVLEAQRLLLLDRPVQARHVIEKALEYNRDQAAESQQLQEFLRNVQRLEARNAGETDGSSVLGDVASRLEAYHHQQGRYPTGYAELNRLLPPERPPLAYFDIVYYAASADTYTLRLRSRINPDRILTLHQTGLLR